MNTDFSNPIVQTMNEKLILKTSIVFFLIVSTSYYWEGKFGFFTLPIFLFLAIAYFVFAVLLLFQLVSAIQTRFVDRSKSIAILMQVMVLIAIFWKPNGLIDFDRLEGENLLIALEGGSANCTFSLKLKDNHTFIQREICFGIYDIDGEYKLRNDTIFFTKMDFNFHCKDYYDFAIVKPHSRRQGGSSTSLVLYANKEDTAGFWLPIQKNELDKLYLKE
jgi:hypothetical protein